MIIDTLFVPVAEFFCLPVAQMSWSTLGALLMLLRLV